MTESMGTELDLWCRSRLLNWWGLLKWWLANGHVTSVFERLVTEYLRSEELVLEHDQSKDRWRQGTEAFLTVYRLVEVDD